jgi:hypothetical protein
VDDDAVEQVTTDDGNKDIERAVRWMFKPPEFDNTFVPTPAINLSERRVCRKLPDAAGARRWTAVHSVALPGGHRAGSPEWFTCGGKSCVFMVACVPPKDCATEVCLAAIDPANPCCG